MGDQNLVHPLLGRNCEAPHSICGPSPAAARQCPPRTSSASAGEHTVLACGWAPSDCSRNEAEHLQVDVCEQRQPRRRWRRWRRLAPTGSGSAGRGGGRPCTLALRSRLWWRQPRWKAGIFTIPLIVTEMSLWSAGGVGWRQGRCSTAWPPIPALPASAAAWSTRWGSHQVVCPCNACTGSGGRRHCAWRALSRSSHGMLPTRLPRAPLRRWCTAIRKWCAPSRQRITCVASSECLRDGVCVRA